MGEESAEVVEAKLEDPRAKMSPEELHRAELIDHLVNTRHEVLVHVQRLEQAGEDLPKLRRRLAAIEATLGQLGWVEPIQESPSVDQARHDATMREYVASLDPKP